MRRYVALASLLQAASAFMAPATLTVAKTVVFKKKDKEAEADDAPPVQVHAMSSGTVVEFDLNKHTTLGIITSHMVKAKGGLRYEVETADHKVHAGVAPNHATTFNDDSEHVVKYNAPAPAAYGFKSVNGTGETGAAESSDVGEDEWN